VSFAPHLAAPGQPPARATVYAEFFSVGHGKPFAAIREATYKLIRRLGTVPAVDELYDLALDPFEQRDLLATPPLTPAQQAAYDALARELDAIRNPAGSVTAYGALACAGSNGFPRIAWSGAPALGASYALELRGGASSQPALLLAGISDERWGALALPFPLSAIGGGRGCELYASGELHAATITDPAGQAAVAIAVPAAAALLGATLFHTWLVVDPAAPSNQLGLTASDGARAVIGR
jgi:hypothetical protein